MVGDEQCAYNVSTRLPTVLPRPHVVNAVCRLWKMMEASVVEDCNSSGSSECYHELLCVEHRYTRLTKGDVGWHGAARIGILSFIWLRLRAVGAAFHWGACHDPSSYCI